MPRDLQQSPRNEFAISDAISGCDLVLYYRLPTTEERIAFQRASFTRKGKTSVNTLPEARAEFGAKILTGIREGDFSCGTDDSGKPVLIASELSSPNYRDNWKEQIAETAGDLLMLLGMNVFEGSFQNLMKNLASDDEDEADNLPLASSSNG